MKIRNKNILIIVLVFNLVLLNSCDIFSTRDAAKPTQPRTSLPPATDLDQLIKNFEDSHKEKLVIDYPYNLSDSVFTGKNFLYIPSSEAASQYPSLNDWDLRSEENYFRNLINASGDSPLNLNLFNSNFSQQGDSLIYSASYSLTISFIEPPNYQGNLDFHILRDNTNVWRIFFWQDFKSGDLPSWSELKGRFAN